MNEFAEWDSFYLIVGGAAGALIGLQFVVMTLITQRVTGNAPPEVGKAFSTPTVVHFTVVLFMAALIRAPWTSITPPTIIGGIVGLAGAIYVIRVHLLVRKQAIYQPVFEDYLFHCILPFAAYLSLVILALIASSNVRIALFGTATAALTLLFTGIHNAWDTVTWHVFQRQSEVEDVSDAIADSNEKVEKQ